MPWHELRAFAAVVHFKAARDELAASGVGASAFSNHEAMELVQGVVSGDPLPADWTEWRVDRAMELIRWADDYRPLDATGAAARVRVLLRGRGMDLLPPALRWGAVAIENRWMPAERVQDELHRAFTLAVEGRAA